MSNNNIKRVSELEANIEKNVQNANDIIELMKLMNEKSFESGVNVASMHALRRVFTRLIDKNYLRPKVLNVSTQLNTAVEKFRIWLLDHYHTYQEDLLLMLESERENCCEVAFQIAVFFCQKGGYEKESSKAVFDQKYYQEIVSKLLSFKTIPEPIHRQLKEEYLTYTDMKYYTYYAMQIILKSRSDAKSEDEETADASNSSISSLSIEELVKRMLYIISLIESPVDETPSLLGVFPEANTTLANQKKNFTALIMLILSQDLSEKLLHYILLKLPNTILPFISQPLFLTDFLTDCYNYGGVLAVMALGGLYYLITNYGVNYPEYYSKLYALLNADVFSLKYRQKFLTLLVKSLRSSAVPALAVAAFCKKLCRIAAKSSPSTALFVIPLITELITYHPSLYPLIQVEDKEDVYDVVSVRKALPGVEEEEVNEVQQKQRKMDYVDVEDEQGEEDEEDEEEDQEDQEKQEDEEVVAEVDDQKPVLRSTTVLSSDIVKRTLERMEMKRQRREHDLELPSKQAKVVYSFANAREFVKKTAVFDPYDEAADLNNSHALESYLWELHVLLHHYDPNVVEMMKKLQTKLLRTRQQFNSVVNVTYNTEFTRLLKDPANRYAPASKQSRFLKGRAMGSMFV